MNKLHRWLVIAVVAFAIGACSTMECDPSRGGFVRGIGCAASGSYGERQQQKQATLQQEQQRQQSLHSEYQRTTDEQAVVRAERQAAERKYASLQSDLKAMKAKLAKSKSGNQDLEQKLAELEAKTDLLQKDTFTPDNQKQEQLNRLRAEKDALETEIDQALQR